MADQKLSNWCLIRIGFEHDVKISRIVLKYGRSELGRNKNADYVCKSNHCSRSHVIFTVTDEKVNIRDTNTSNGTYVNEVMYKGEVIDLKLNDMIGIGCNIPIPELYNNSLYFMYYLKQLNADSSVIDLDDFCAKVVIPVDDSDDEEEQKKDNFEISQQFQMDIKREIADIDDWLDSQDRLLHGKNIKVEIKEEPPDENDIPANIKCEPVTYLNEADPIFIQDSDDEEAMDEIWLNRLSQGVRLREINAATVSDDNEEEAEEIEIANKEKDDEVAINIENEEVEHRKKESEVRSKTKEKDSNKQNNRKRKKEDHHHKSHKPKRRDDRKQSHDQSDKKSEHPNHIVEINSKETQPKQDNILEIVKTKANKITYKKTEFTDPKPITTRRHSIAFRTSSSLEKSSKTISKPSVKDLVKIRLKKLNDLAPKIADSSTDMRTHTTPKVKISVNRGQFLVDMPPPKPISRRKSCDTRTLAVAPASSKKESSEGTTKVTTSKSVTETTIETDTTPEELLLEINRNMGLIDGSNIALDTYGKIKLYDSAGKIKKSRVSHANRPVSKLVDVDIFSASALEPVEPIPSTSKKAYPQSRAIKAASKVPQTITEHILPPTNDLKLPLKSILKKRQSAIEKSHKTIMKMVTFDDTPYVKEFESTSEHVAVQSILGKKDASTPLQLIKHTNSLKCDKVSFQSDPCHEVITSLTSLEPRWLDEKFLDAPINGHGHILEPMVQDYSSFAAFKRIMMPILKVELWRSIQVDYSSTKQSSNIEVALKFVNLERRDASKRFVYHCHVPLNNVTYRLSTDDVVLVTHKVDKEYKEFLAFIADLRTTGDEYNKTVYFIMEASKTSGNESLTMKTHKIQIKQISFIRDSLHLFSAVNALEKSPLLDNILHPLLNAINDLETINLNYKGYDKLNEGQMEILTKLYQRCLNDAEPNITLVDGPPGTGKSRVIVNLALQLCYGVELANNKRKILICGQSNAATDVICARLLRIRQKMTGEESRKFNLIRYGLSDRVAAEVKPITVTELAKRKKPDEITQQKVLSLTTEEGALKLKIRAQELQKMSDNTNDVDLLDKLKYRLKFIQTKIKKILDIDSKQIETAYFEYLNGADIICCTLGGCAKVLKYVKSLDVCIVDEATQCNEALTLLPLQFKISSYILVGDTRQLPPTVLSMVADQHGYGQSYFTRIRNSFEGNRKSPVLSLTSQYRMHSEICLWPNKYFYNNSLTTNPSCDEKFSLRPYAVLSLEYMQSSKVGEKHISNETEADFIVQLLSALFYYADPKVYSYAVITPYAQQRQHLTIKLCNGSINVPVNTIDSFQGREVDILIYACTRTNGVGFLSNAQRLNVALTRARKCMIICANFVSLKINKMWKSLIEDAKNRKILFECNSSDKNKFESTVIKKIVIQNGTTNGPKNYITNGKDVPIKTNEVTINGDFQMPLQNLNQPRPLLDLNIPKPNCVINNSNLPIAKRQT